MSEDEVAADLMAAVSVALAAVRRHTLSLQDAEDCVADALETALRIALAEPVENPGALLVTIARRRAADRMRAHVRRRRMLHLLTHGTPTTVADIAGDVVDAAEAAWVWERLAPRLPKRTVALLEQLGAGATLAEAAERLGMTRRAAESRLHRSRRLLRAMELGLLGAFLATGWRALRRSWVLAPHAALVAAMVLPFVLPWTGPPANPPTTPRPYEAGPADDRTGRRAALSAEGSDPGLPAAPTRSRPPAVRDHAAEAPEVVLLVDDGDGGRAVVTKEDRDGPDDPVYGTLWCLRHWRVTLEHVGC